MKHLLYALVVVTSVAASVQAQSYQAFNSRQSATFSAPAFTDLEVATLLGTLDRLILAAPAGAKWTDVVRDALWQFAKRVQGSRLTPAQEGRITAYLDTLARSRPGAASIMEGPRQSITHFSVGKAAPEITGQDLDGRQFKLGDYRGQVVLVVFSADWCAICRAGAPYERFLLDKYARWPFAVLGVETGESRDAARQTRHADPLTTRSWWDAPRPGEVSGSIAAAWNVSGLPATFLIDGDGVIQAVGLREEPLLVAVRQLVEAQADRNLKSQRSKK